MAEREPYVEVGVTDSPLDLHRALGAASDPEVGGIGVFVGTVRSSAAVAANEGKDVTSLTYDAHPTLASAELEAICGEAAQKWDVHRLVAYHRTGTCELGEPTVVVVCGAPHRADALEATRFVIDQLKARAPIWKREDYADGSSWVNQEGVRGNQ